MTMPWFRMYAEAVDDEKLRLLAFEDRWHFVAILCLKCSSILDEKDDDLKRRKVAVKLGLDLRELGEVARRLADVGLIDAETLQPIAWKMRQFQSDSAKDRMRRYREKKREQKQKRENVKRNGDVTVTSQDTDTDTDTENIEPIGSCPTSPSEAERAPAHKPCPYEEIRSLWIEVLPELRRPIGTEHWTAQRKAQIRNRWRDQLPDLDAWRECFELVRKSRFLMGKGPANGRKPFEADLFWIAKPENLLKLYEGKYHG
jgi:hypothetical protein